MQTAYRILAILHDIEAAQAHLLITIDQRVARLNERMTAVCARFGRVYVERQVRALRS